MASLKSSHRRVEGSDGESLRAARGEVRKRDGVERAGGPDLTLGVRADGVFEYVERIYGLETDLVAGGGHAGRKRNAA